MKWKQWVKVYGVLLGILLLFNAATLYGQEPTADTSAAGVQETKESVFKFEEAIITNLDGKIPDAKLDGIKTLQDQEFSEAQLSVTLTGLGFNEDEIRIVLENVQKHLKFAKAVRMAAPIAILVNNAKEEIQKKEAAIESTEQKDVKKKLSDELEKLRRQLKKHEGNFSEITKGVDGTRTELIADILEASGYKSDEIEIISDYLLKQALFAKNINTLSEMVQSIDSITKEIRVYEEKLKNATTEGEKKSISNYLVELNARLQKTKNDFSILTTGIDYSTFLKKEGKEVNWEKELKEIFSPIIVELKETTERPRKMERLRSEILYYDKRLPQVRKASEDIEKFLKKVTDEKVRARLTMWKEYWEQLEKEFSTQKEAAEHQLIEEERTRKSLWKSFKIFFDSFIKHRGKNLFFAVLAFFVIYLVFRFLQRLVWKFSPIHRSPKYMFWANLIDVVFLLLTFIAAGGALLIVLYTSGDWLILAIVLLIVLGIIWGARNTIPMFAEQIKILLGFGPVRQGERIMIDGIPYRIEMLGVYSYLKNPLLTGGTIRLPLKDLIGMRSRPYDERELWFPCKEGHWVLLNENSLTQILMQTPQVVKINYWGVNMVAVMPTKMFLSQTLVNLSATPTFWWGVSLFVDPKHRVTVLEEGFIGKLEKLIAEDIKSTSYGEHLVAPWAEVAAIKSSSIEIWMWAELKSEAASNLNALKRLLSRTALKAANQYGLEFIQFTHVNLHQPEGAQGLLEHKEA